MYIFAIFITSSVHRCMLISKKSRLLKSSKLLFYCLIRFTIVLGRGQISRFTYICPQIDRTDLS